MDINATDNIEDIINEFLENEKENRQHIHQYSEIDSSPKKLIDCPHEIIATLDISVMEQNSQGENIFSKESHIRHYHIPVPPKHDYNVYANAFIKKFEQALANSTTELNKDINHE